MILQPCQRVSYFQRRGPDVNYAYTHTRPHLVPWDSVHDLGEEGFVEGKWADLPEVKS